MNKMEKYYHPIILNGLIADEKLDRLEKRLKEKGAIFIVENSIYPLKISWAYGFRFEKSSLYVERKQKIRRGTFPSLNVEITAYIIGSNKELKNDFEEIFDINNKKDYKKKGWTEKIFSN